MSGMYKGEDLTPRLFSLPTAGEMKVRGREIIVGDSHVPIRMKEKSGLRVVTLYLVIVTLLFVLT